MGKSFRGKNLEVFPRSDHDATGDSMDSSIDELHESNNELVQEMTNLFIANGVSPATLKEINKLPQSMDVREGNTAKIRVGGMEQDWIVEYHPDTGYGYYGAEEEAAREQFPVIVTQSDFVHELKKASEELKSMIDELLNIGVSNDELIEVMNLGRGNHKMNVIVSDSSGRQYLVTRSQAGEYRLEKKESGWNQN